MDNHVIKEYIKVKNYGLFFHDHYFNTLKELIGWFKSNYRTDDYKRYVRKTKPPFLGNTNTILKF